MIQLLVHDKNDTVGVVTVDVKAGNLVKGLYLDTNEPIEIKPIEDIPLGHKIALRDHKVKGGVQEYGYDIGQVVADIKAGEHVHIHNLKTKRW